MIEIFLHHQQVRTVKLVNADPEWTAEEFAIECAGRGASVWLEDAKESLQPETRLSELGITGRCHLHVSCRPAVEVKVRYAGHTIESSVSPALTIGILHKWAASPEGFKLTDNESAKHILVISGTNTELDQADHIGCWVDDHCSVSLDLLPKERFEGSVQP